MAALRRLSAQVSVANEMGQEEEWGLIQQLW